MRIFKTEQKSHSKGIREEEEVDSNNLAGATIKKVQNLQKQLVPLEFLGISWRGYMGRVVFSTYLQTRGRQKKQT